MVSHGLFQKRKHTKGWSFDGAGRKKSTKSDAQSIPLVSNEEAIDHYPESLELYMHSTPVVNAQAIGVDLQKSSIMSPQTRIKYQQNQHFALQVERSALTLKARSPQN